MRWRWRGGTREPCWGFPVSSWWRGRSPTSPCSSTSRAGPSAWRRWSSGGGCESRFAKRGRQPAKRQAVAREQHEEAPMSELKQYSADHRYLLDQAARAGGLSRPVAIDMDEFYTPLIRASRRRELVPIDGVLVRDWDPDGRRVA